jgi:hypothetical protein
MLARSLNTFVAGLAFGSLNLVGQQVAQPSALAAAPQPLKAMP